MGYDTQSWVEWGMGSEVEERQVREQYTMYHYFNLTFISFCILMENDLKLIFYFIAYSWKIYYTTNKSNGNRNSSKYTHKS